MTITKITREEHNKPNFIIELSDDEARELVMRLAMSADYSPDILISLGIAIKSNQIGIYQSEGRQEDFNNIITQFRNQNPILVGLIEAEKSLKST